jgi:hypothetical protein
MWSVLKRSRSDSKHLYRTYLRFIPASVSTYSVLCYEYTKTNTVRNLRQWPREMRGNWLVTGGRLDAYSVWPVGLWCTQRNTNQVLDSREGYVRQNTVVDELKAIWEFGGGLGNCAHSSKPKLGACFSIEHTKVRTNSKLVCVYEQRLKYNDVPDRNASQLQPESQATAVGCPFSLTLSNTEFLLETSPSFSIHYVHKYLRYMELNPAICGTRYNWKTANNVREIGDWRDVCWRETAEWKLQLTPKLEGLNYE